MDSITIIFSFIGIIITAAIAYWAGQSRDRTVKDTEELAKVVKEVEQLKVTSVSEQRVREIIKDAIEPTGADVKDIKTSMLELNKILQKIQIDIATENAYKRGKNIHLAREE